MAENTTLIFVRHGETQANIDGLLAGQVETKLTSRGIAQAEAAANALKDKPIAIAYASDLTRAFQTAKIIINHHPGIELKPEPRLREWSFGDLEHVPYKKLLEPGQTFFEHYENPRDDYQPANGESRSQLSARIKDFMDECVSIHPGKTILAVCHGALLQQLFVQVAGMPPCDTIPPLAANASISVFRFVTKRNKWQLVTWSSVDHLAEIGEFPTF